jgi:dTDP-4-dehydrorhamnose 3,5-epimerase
VRVIDRVLGGVLVLEPIVHGDGRGFFLEFYNARAFAAVGIRCAFVQDAHSMSGRGVLRGLHYQLRQPQPTLVRVVEGEVFDVAVDLRRGSPTFARWHAARLSADNRRMLFLPAGFAHGFQVLSARAQIIYKLGDFYAPDDDRGVAWNDPTIGVAWPLDGDPVLSPRDRGLRPLADTPAEDLPLYDPRAAQEAP